MAATQAMARGALPQAIGDFERALALLKALFFAVGNGPPVAVANGMASAAASDTMPRMPVKDSTNGHCQGGDGSFLLIGGNSQRGR